MKKNVIVGQSGGPTAVINASLAGVYKTAKDMGADTIYGMRYGIQGLLEKKIVDLGEKIRNDMDVELLKRTPASFLGSCRYKLPEISVDKTIYERIFAILEELEIMAFFYIGGNDSMDTIKKLSDYAQTVDSPIRFIGVPKTIDNDLEGTDHTPGYGSAAKYIATVTKELVRDGLIYEMQSVTVIEIMGRNAGWLTGAAVLAKSEDCEGPDLIYLPEVPFDVDGFFEKGKKLYEWTQRNLQDSADYLYFDNIRLDGKIGKAKFAYNSGQMMQSAALLYQLTKNPIYLKDAQNIAKECFNYFFTDFTPTTNEEAFRMLKKGDIWFTAVMLRGFIELYQIDKDKTYINAFNKSLSYAWDNARDENGLFNTDLSGKSKDQKKWLLTQAAMVEMYSRLAMIQ